MEIFIYAFQSVPGLTYVHLSHLWNFFKNWQYAWEKGTLAEYQKAGIRAEFSEEICYWRKKIDLPRAFSKLLEKDIMVLTPDSKEFPSSLKTIPCPPFLLYRKGAALDNHQPHIAVVGSRIASSYGEKMALMIAENIAMSGGIVVSGLAFGIDAIAHFAAVKNNLPTIAVLASGLDYVTPTSHTGLARKILETGGTLLSEYPPDHLSFKNNFLERNRLISGLCKATIVVEAKERSGALITAHHALEQQRDIYALVGDIHRPQARGCLKLLMDGVAYPIFNIDELLQQLGFSSGVVRQKKLQFGLDEEARKIFSLIEHRPVFTETILEQTSLKPGNLGVILTTLEMKNLIQKDLMGKWKAL